MHIGFYNYYNIYNKNKMLTDPSSAVGDNLMYPFFYLAEQLRKMGHLANTIDSNDLKKFDAIVFVEFPGINNKYLKRLIKNGFKNLYLIALESPIIKPENYNKENHKHFKKVFTFNDNLIDNKKYFKINYSHKIPSNFDFSLNKKEKLCTIIAGNKVVKHPSELYTERIKAIRWFETNHPEDFDLYGNGWDEHNFQGRILGVNIARLNRLTFLAKILRPYYPSYKRTVKSKIETYKKYKFSICYENARDFSGYITEKIFDCFFGGCVPIYWGAKNITNRIPQNAFINKKKFQTYDALYSYIKNMPDKEYLNYLKSIEDFLKSGRAHQFSAEYFANALIKEIT